MPIPAKKSVETRRLLFIAAKPSRWNLASPHTRREQTTQLTGNDPPVGERPVAQKRPEAAQPLTVPERRPLDCAEEPRELLRAREKALEVGARVEPKRNLFEALAASKARLGMLAAQEHALRHFDELAAQRQLDEQDLIRGHVGADPGRFEQHVAADQAEDGVAEAHLPQQAGEPRARALVLQVEAVVVFGQELAFGTNQTCTRIAQHGAGHGLDRRKASLEMLGLQEVVVRSPLEVAAPRKLDAAVVVPGGSAIGVAAVHPDAGIAGGELREDRSGIVRRGVVTRDDLEIPVALPQERLEGRCEVALPVEDGETDADGGRGAQ
jgi:hypothetical protein